MLLQTDGANPTPYTQPGKVEMVEGRWPEEGEESMMGWVMVRGRKVCQVETETEETKTPEARRKLDPVPSPPPRVVVGSKRWWSMDEREQERMVQEWEMKWKKAGQKS